MDLQQDWFQSLYDDLCNAKKEFSLAIHWEEILIRDQSRSKWLMEGDRHSAFFHASMKERKLYAKFHLCLASVVDLMADLASLNELVLESERGNASPFL